MRWLAGILGVVLVATMALAGVVVMRQRASILGATQKGTALEHDLAESYGALGDRDRRIEELTSAAAKLEAQRAEHEKQGKALTSQLTAQQLAAAGQQRALAELGELQRDRDAAKARLDQLTRFVSQFKKLIDTGKLTVEVRRGRLALVMPNDVLFDEAKVAIKPDAQAALHEIAETLKGVKDRQFEIVGHTDSTPMKSTEFPSNWELSTTRALAVVKLLIESGVPGGMLAATGRGEWEPRDVNFTPYGRAKNRRIEIVLEPQVGELMKLSQLKM